MSLVQALFDQVEQLRREHNQGRVVTIRVGIGEMAGVDAGLFQSAFDVFVAVNDSGSPQLEVAEIPLEAECRGCRDRFRIERFLFVCSRCGGNDLTVCQGDALILQSVTFETEEIPHGRAGDAEKSHLSGGGCRRRLETACCHGGSQGSAG